MQRERAEELLPFYIDKFHPEVVVLGPGLEEAQATGICVLNNLAKKTALISDKLWQARWLEKNGFPFIRTQTSPDDLHFPIIVKPRKGAGGVGCRLVKSENDLSMDDDLILQSLVSGRPASVSVIGNGHEARALAVNEQLIGAPWTGAKGFRYSGNITPLQKPHFNIAEMAEEIIAKLGLLGSNGVDFLLTRQGPVVVEVNARFQGSLDSVEQATGINVFQAHLQSFQGTLPKRPVAGCTAGRAIIYASRDLEIKKDLCRDWIADVPRIGSRINKDDPVLSILAKGSGRDEIVSLLMKRAATLAGILRAK
jgi:predicted ATP-grasp superfamily ATP-dependent carboligase